jgi:hypothetical protein
LLAERFEQHRELAVEHTPGDEPRTGLVRVLHAGELEVADILWTINHPNTWQLLVVDRGWTPPQYEQWIGDLACAQLLRPRRATPRRPGAASTDRPTSAR